MQIRLSIVAGTALALLISAGHVLAAQSAPPAMASYIVAQAQEELSEEELLRRRAEEEIDNNPDSAPEEPEPVLPQEAPAPSDPVEQPVETPEPQPQQEAPTQPDQPEQEASEPTPTDEIQTGQPQEETAPTPEEVPTPPEQQESLPEQEEPQTPEQAPIPPAEQPAPTPPEAPAPAPAEETPLPPDDGELTPEDQSQPVEESTEPAREAPLLDSQKESETGQPAQTAPQERPATDTSPPPPPPASDQEAQQLEVPVEIMPLRAEEGRRIDRREERRERHEGMQVLREIGDRVVIQLNNQVIVQSDDRDRIGYNAEEVYYEELPRGRTRETVVRPNGVQVVTVYDRWGDVVRRSRIMPDGYEQVLVYSDDRRRDDRRQWRDPGLDLPPLRLNIPANEYILDAGRVRDERTYYDFLDQPPVEPVRRLYSIDEVRYSARVRDSVRRVELDTITFDFGSAAISEQAIPLLSGVAQAIEQMLDRNPGEVFLIEGHTDAVGSNEANLALSDRRAEAVAMALTNVFGIAPENLVTQGYGERYLKIATQAPERQNRRVAIRRITALVAPAISSR